jgi:hypothetical protein
MSRGCRMSAAVLFCAALIFIQFGVRWLPGRYGGQLSKRISVLVDCPGGRGQSRLMKSSLFY